MGDFDWADDDDMADFPVCPTCGDRLDWCPDYRPATADADRLHAIGNHTKCDPDLCIHAEDMAERA